MSASSVHASASGDTSHARLHVRNRIPDLSAHHVSRSRLVGLVDTLLGDTSLAVVAPLGFGKTALLSEWHSHAGSATPLAWISVDKGLNDAAALLSAMISSLSSCDGLGDAVGDWLASHAGLCDEGDAEALLAAFRELAAESGSGMVVCLDGCERITDEMALGVLEELIGHPPAHVHFALLSRNERFAPIPLLAEQGALAMLTERDLRLTEGEVAGFFEQVVARAPTGSELEELCSFVDGWPVALRLESSRLMSYRLAEQENPDDPGHRMTQHDVRTINTLFESVLCSIPDELRDFLLATSILDEMSIPLCRAVYQSYRQHGSFDDDGMARTADPEGISQTTIRELHTASDALFHQLFSEHLFLYPTDENERWCRYQARFADYLRAELKLNHAPAMTSLHCAVGDWYSQRADPRKFLTQSIRHYQIGGDWEKAAALVEEHGMETAMNGRLDLVSEWAAGFPAKVLEQRPGLRMLKSWAAFGSVGSEERLILREHFAETQSSLSPAEEDDPVRQNLANIMLVDLTPNRDLDAVNLAQTSRAAADSLQGSDLMTVSLALAEALAYAALSRTEEALEGFQKGKRIAYNTGSLAYVADNGYFEALTAIEQGRFEQALSICRQEKEHCASIAEDEKAAALFSGFLDLAQAFALTELGRYTEADAAFQRAGADPIVLSTTHFHVEYLLGLYRLRRATGMSDDADAILEQLATTMPDYTFVAEVFRERDRLSGDPESTMRTSVGLGCSPLSSGEVHTPGFGPLGGCEIYYASYLAWARVQTLSGRPEAALKYLDAQIRFDDTGALYGRVPAEKVERAFALQALGRGGEARDTMREALQLGLSTHGVCTFSDDRMSGLMIKAASTREMRDFVQHVLDCQTSSHAKEITSAPDREDAGKAAGESLSRTDEADGENLPASMTDDIVMAQLSEREQEVLQLIADGLSNKAIAVHLHVSVGTVKVHISSILRKLGVSNRTQAANFLRRGPLRSGNPQ